MPLTKRNFSPIKAQMQKATPKIIVQNGEVYDKPEKISCTCTKTECLKSYCACFKAGKKCEKCQCKGCKNTSEKTSDKLNKLLNDSGTSVDGQTKELLNSGKICNCSKSNCLKRYCECFKQGRKCDDSCRCQGCRNKDGLTHTDYKPLFNTTSKASSNPSPTESNRFITKRFDSEKVPSMAHLDEIKDKPLTEFLEGNMKVNSPPSFSIKLRSEAMEIYVKQGTLKIALRSLTKNRLDTVKRHEKQDILSSSDKRENLLTHGKGSENLHGTPQFTNKKRLNPKTEKSEFPSSPVTAPSTTKNKAANHVDVSSNVKTKKLVLN